MATGIPCPGSREVSVMLPDPAAFLITYLLLPIRQFTIVMLC
jgi:hypothetical protein